MIIRFFTPHGLSKELECRHIQVNHKIGSFGVLENHVPILSVVEKGTILVSAEKEQYFAISSAIFKFQNNEASVTCEGLEEGDSFENAMDNLNASLERRRKENRERNIELALVENELKKQIKKTGAGQI